MLQLYCPQLLHLLSVLLKDEFSHTSMILQTDGSVSFRVHLKYVLEAFMEVCVTLAGIKKLPRLCVIASLDKDMVSILANTDIVDLY